MSTALLERPVVELGSGNGGVPARRAVVRWAWRLFWREWRQQFLVLALIVLAVAATIVGATVATNSPSPANAGFGTAGYMANVPVGPRLTADMAALKAHFGTLDVIENQTVAVPGSIDTFSLRAQDPHGPYGQPLLHLVAGRYPSAADEVAVTPVVASDFNLHVGAVWHVEGQSRRVVGTVENPQSLLDAFALVPPDQVHAPTTVTVLLDATPASASAFHLPSGTANGGGLHSPPPNPSGGFNPATIVLVLATLGMLLIGLVAVAGFTVLAQRRLRSIGMLGALGATDKNIRLVVRANGVVVGVMGTLLGAVVGVVAWLAYRPHLESSSHHLIGALQLPWVVVAVAMALAVVTAFLAAARPARTVTRIPIVTALSGRPGPPKAAHRSAVPGVLILVIAFLLLTIAGSTNGNGGGGPELVFGFVALIVSIIFLAPLCVSALAGFGRSAPISVRLALRDLARYRSRSGSALAAISLGALIAVIICVAGNVRYSDVLDYAGPNLASNQLVLYTPDSPQGNGGPAGPSPTATSAGTLKAMDAAAHAIAASLGSHTVVALDSTSATLDHATHGSNNGNSNFNGQVYVATPALMHAFGITASQVDRNADILTARNGLSSVTNMELIYGSPSGKGQIFSGNGPPPGSGGGGSSDCSRGSCVANPVIQTVSQLPAGTSAPNTVITEHAVHQLGLQPSLSTMGWLIDTPQVLTAAQITAARQTAGVAGMTTETKNDAPTSAEVLNWATAAGVLLALAVLAMTVGLIRSETAGDLQTLTATGASTTTRRAITAATAGALALLGALIGTVGGYVAAIAFFRSSRLTGLAGVFTHTPLVNLATVLIGLPLLAVIGGWLFAGREPPAISRQPAE
jgi:putative ABC transport system permease protein